MTPPNDLFGNLAARVESGDAAAQPRLRAELESSLVPMIRCVLRRGTGLPQLVSWVQKNLSRARPAVHGEDTPMDPDRAAPLMARLLSATLMRQLQSRTLSNRAAWETVVGL
jgi:hypothetical protein